MEIKKFEIEKIKTFLKTKGKKLLFYHQDPDGVCSAAIVLKFLPDFECQTREGPRMERVFVEDVIAKEPGLILFLDLPVDQEFARIKEVLRRLPEVKILIIDHHIAERDLTGERILHINPRFEKDVYLPASYLVYEIFDKLGKNVKPLVWIAAIGIIGDHAFEDCKGFLEKCGGMKFAKGAELISSAITLEGMRGTNKSLEILTGSKTPAEFLENRQLIEWDGIVKNEVERILRDFEKKKETNPEANLIIYEVKSKFNIASVIASAVTQKYPDSVILIRKRAVQGWKVSVRAQMPGINIGNLVKKCVKGIGWGGGHENAAGAVTSDWEEFRERFIKNLI